MSHSPLKTSTPSSPACEPAALSSSANWSAMRKATGSATSAAPRGSSSSWPSASADGAGRRPGSVGRWRENHLHKLQNLGQEPGVLHVHDVLRLSVPLCKFRMRHCGIIGVALVSRQSREDQGLVRPGSPWSVRHPIIDVTTKYSAVDCHIHTQIAIIEDRVTGGAALEESSCI